MKEMVLKNVEKKRVQSLKGKKGASWDQTATNAKILISQKKRGNVSTEGSLRKGLLARLEFTERSSPTLLLRKTRKTSARKK